MHPPNTVRLSSLDPSDRFGKRVFLSDNKIGEVIIVHDNDTVEVSMGENSGRIKSFAARNLWVQLKDSKTNAIQQPARSSCSYDVGFVFYKYFEGYGLFRGIVTEVDRGWNDNTKSRRVIYPADGDSEDLSVVELKSLAKIYPVEYYGNRRDVSGEKQFRLFQSNLEKTKRHREEEKKEKERTCTDGDTSNLLPQRRSSSQSCSSSFSIPSLKSEDTCPVGRTEKKSKFSSSSETYREIRVKIRYQNDEKIECSAIVGSNWKIHNRPPSSVLSIPSSPNIKNDSSNNTSLSGYESFESSISLPTLESGMKSKNGIEMVPKSIESVGSYLNTPRSGMNADDNISLSASSLHMAPRQTSPPSSFSIPLGKSEERNLLVSEGGVETAPSSSHLSREIMVAIRCDNHATKQCAAIVGGSWKIKHQFSKKSDDKEGDSNNLKGNIGYESSRCFGTSGTMGTIGKGMRFGRNNTSLAHPQSLQNRSTVEIAAVPATAEARKRGTVLPPPPSFLSSTTGSYSSSKETSSLISVSEPIDLNRAKTSSSFSSVSNPSRHETSRSSFTSIPNSGCLSSCKKSPSCSPYKTIISSDDIVFSPLGQHIPIDESAESSLQIDQMLHSVVEEEEEDDETEEWLGNVASMLSVSWGNAPKQHQQRQKKSLSNTYNGGVKEKKSEDAHPLGKNGENRCTPIIRGKRITPSSRIDGKTCGIVMQSKARSSSSRGTITTEKLFHPLSTISTESRHGAKVFHVKDPKCVVGEVIYSANGWVEAEINSSHIRGRVGEFYIVPTQSFAIGESVHNSVSIDSSDNISNNGATSTGIPRYGQPKRKILVNAVTCLSAKTCVDGYVASSRHSLKRIRADNCHSISKRNIESTSSNDYGREETLYKLKKKYYWNCHYCTMINYFYSLKCQACHLHKTTESKMSPYLEIAYKAANNANNVNEAKNNLPEQYRSIISERCLSAIILCGYEMSSGFKCRRKKASGKLFCSIHDNPHLSHLQQSNKASNESFVSGDEASISDISNHVKSNTVGDQTKKVQKSMVNIIGEIGTKYVNSRKWRISSMEDSIIATEFGPFPLGMKFRKYWGQQYGFHDGKIIKVWRKFVYDEKLGQKRPVFVYRTQYDDGDGEDLMHYEINSLRQIYDVQNYSRFESPEIQMPPGTKYEVQKNGIIEVIKHITPKKQKYAKVVGCYLLVRFEIKGSSPKQLKLLLSELQLNVVRHLPNFNAPIRKNSKQLEIPQSESSFNEIFPLLPTKPPLLEWPRRQQTKNSLLDLSENEDCLYDKEWLLSRGFWLSWKEVPGSLDETLTQIKLEKGDKQECCISSKKSYGVFDPANVMRNLKWDPFGNTRCEICDMDKDDSRMLICDSCNLGYHMYCVRPVIVNIPNGDWLCSNCSDNEVFNFSDMAMKLKQDGSVANFLCLPFSDVGQFHIENKHALDSVSKIQKVKKQNSQPTVLLGSLFFDYSVHRNHWRLPMPLKNMEMYVESLTSFVTAMKYCGMTSYSDDLVYSNILESMNDFSLDVVQPMSQRNLKVFLDFKENTKNGAFPPIAVTHDEAIGFTVRALAQIEKHALIMEYAGEVTTVDRSVDTDSDSLMMLLDTGDDKTSLMIDPTKTGNMARFLSGVNNRSWNSFRKVNVRTRRFPVDGKCRVALFAAKKIVRGEPLLYDYNAGMQGKEDVEWAKNGFYDTSNFY